MALARTPEEARARAVLTVRGGDAGLGRCVVGLSRWPGEERLGGGVDDRGVHGGAGLLGLAAPVGRRVAREQEVAAQVHTDDVVPLLVGEVEQHPVARHPGVVHHDVEGAEAVDRGRQHGVGGRPLGDVAGGHDGLAATATDLLGHAVRGTGEVVEHEPGARVGQGERLGSSETGAGTGDHGDPAVEAEGGGRHRLTPRPA